LQSSTEDLFSGGVLEKVIILRAHHLLCLLGFKGLGYSTSFVENLKKIYKEVKQSSSLIKIVIEEDDVCKACPFVDGNCPGRSNPVEKDLMVLSKLKIKPSQVFRSEEIYRIITKNFKSEDLNSVCEGCQWLGEGWCREGLKKVKSFVAV
jgi:hypothetical protein